MAGFRSWWTGGGPWGTLGRLFEGGKGQTEEEFLKLAKQIYARGQVTPEEQEQYQGSFGMGQDIESIMRYMQGMGDKPEGYLTGEEQYQKGGPLAEAYYGQTLKGVQDPYAAYESQLQPALEQTQDYINRQAQGRGLIRSGMPIEQMGRAGVELSIKEAQERMRFREGELQRGAGLSQYGFGLQQQNLMNLAGLYGQQQQFGLQAMGRQAGQAQAAGQYQAYPSQAALGDIYGRRAAGYALPGQLLGAAGQAAGAYYGASGIT